MTDSITPIGIVDELKQSYLDYAMSVIVSRALPDVRDGLKPVHRRVMYAMHELSNDYNKPYKKSARVVGDVIGKYHPHGDSAVYDAIVRLAQPFSMRYMLVDGQGNFGSVDGDPPAAMRYTEVRMQKLTHQMLADLDKDTVDWEDNYDGSEKMPSVLPARLPNLLINGATGIAVGMATNMAPHNITEVINACLAFVDNPHISTEALSTHISGPDFPTGGIIYGRSGILDAYRTGKGRLHIRGRYHIENMDGASKDRERIVFTEIPYQVNKAKLIEQIASLVNDKKIEGISSIRDESDKEGMRIAIDLKRGENAEVVVNNLFNQTPLESSFSINMVALDNGQPRLMTLRDLIGAFIRHRQEVVTRRTIFELNKAKARGHLLEGLTIALANIDDIITTIKHSANRTQAREALLSKVWQAGGVVAMLKNAGATSVRPDFIEGEDLNAPFGLINQETQYRLSPDQVGAILDMQLHRLTGLEQDKLSKEYQEILAQIAYLMAILADFDKLMGVIREELTQILAEFGDERKTDIVDARHDFSREDLIPEQTVVLTVSRTGYAKTQPISDYQAQKRGGKGRSATNMKEDDVIEHLLVTSTHATILCFTNTGRVFGLRGFEVPIASRGSKGRPLVNLIDLTTDESVTAILPVQNLKDDDKFVFFATASGTVKKVALSAFANLRNNGLKAIELADGDTLIGVALTDGSAEIMLFSNEGKAIRFKESAVRAMGRSARGVRGMKVNLLANLGLDDEPETDNDGDDGDSDSVVAVSRVVSLLVAEPNSANQVLCACEKGFGKRTPISEFTLRENRGSQGNIAIKTSERNGELVKAVMVTGDEDVILISSKGTLVRTPVAQIATTGRNAQGVKLIRIAGEEVLVGVACVEHEEPDDTEDDLENAQSTNDNASETMPENTSNQNTAD